MTDCCPEALHIDRPADACPHCLGAGVINLPADLYEIPDVVCPYCQPDAYPAGFPGIRAQPTERFDHWLIPPGAGPEA